MAQEKDERPSAGGKKTSETGDESIRRAAGAQARTAARNGGEVGLTTPPPGSRRERYIIGNRAAPAGQPFAPTEHSMDDVVDYLNRQENVELVKRVSLGGTRPFTANGRNGEEVVVVKMDPGKAQRLQAIAPPHLIIERDAPLECADYLSVPAGFAPFGTLLPLRPMATEIAFRVIGEREHPLARAMVVIEGGGPPSQALTDDSGVARLTFFGDSIESVQALFVRAPANHWDRLIRAPRLSSGTNTVKLRPLAETFPSFPGERLQGWGQRLMRIDPAGGRFTGNGVKIGVIDSGCDNSHPLLRHLLHGRDYTPAGTETSWTHDLLSHGTHCAGILNAASTGQGVAGCAPEAELHALKVAPGGRISDLLVALDECIERELDLIHIGVVSDGFSELVTQKLHEARRMGIACIAPAGNTGGALAFPASLRAVIAVAAVGRLGQFPADSSHALSVIPQLVGSDGIFAAAFSSAGPQVTVSAPGVAIVSTVPGGGYAAADGTSAAAAHVTGLAALVLAHHPIFREGPFSVRSEQRVNALFELIRASAVPHFADPLRSGFGVPDLSRVPGGQSFSASLSTSENWERVAQPPYGPAAAQGGWPAVGGLF
jgi:subtilisin